MKLLILRSEALSAETICSTIESRLPESIVFGFSTARKALRHIEHHPVDLALVSLQNHDMDGIDHLPVFAVSPNVGRLLILSSRKDSRTLLLLRTLRFDGFVDSSQSTMEELLIAIKHAMAGKRYFSADVEKSMATARNAPHAQFLTKREQLLLAALAEGSTNSKIGQHLNLSEATVRTHRHNIMLKLNLHHKGELMLFATKHCFIRHTPSGILYPGYHRELGSKQRPIDS